MFKISLSLWVLCGHQSSYHCAAASNHSSGNISECFQPRTIRQPNVMDVLNSPTLPSQLLSKTWWLLLHFKISQIRHVPIFKLEFNLLPEFPGVAAFMLGQRRRSGAWECRAGPLLSEQIYHFWIGGKFMHCKFAPACLEALSSQALLRFKHAFWLCFLWSFLIH